ncbi:MAG: FAD-binding oxidoreductase [Burkholderiales bacterium]|nr:FAD-binding oxidoreductase [Phycisphaerae bacterium]
MDLKTGRLLWPSLSTPRVVPQSLSGDVHCDVIIIGAGVSGAMLACRLADVGVEAVVVDRRGVAEGSTPASTALIQYEIDTTLIDLSKMHGLDSAQRAYRASYEALDELTDLVAQHDIDCGLHRTGSVFLARRDKDAAGFAEEAAARRAIGIDASVLSRGELMERFDIDRPAAIYSPAAMQLDPFKLTHGLLAAAVARGVKVFAADVTPHELGDARQTLVSNEGVKLTCRHLIIAMGYETPETFARLRKLCQIKSTYALASQPLAVASAWPERALIWESADPYFYARQTDDNRVLIGGEDENTADPQKRDALIGRKIKLLLKMFAELRPGVTIEPEFAWAGTFAETADGLPFIGCDKQWPGCHFALGYGGNGITFSVLAAGIIRDAILGKTNERAGLFRFDR